MTLMFRTYRLDLGHVVINKKWNGPISWLFLNYQLSHFKPCWQNNYCCTKTNTNCVHRQLHDKLWDAICIVSYVDDLDLLHCAVLSLNVESLLSLLSLISMEFFGRLKYTPYISLNVRCTCKETFLVFI